MVQGPRPWFKGVALQGVSTRPFKRSRSNPRRNTIIVSESPIFAPVLVQITMVHEPRLQLLQFAAHLTPLLCKAPRFCPLLFGVEPVFGSSLCESRNAILGPWSGGSPSMELTAAHREPGGTLAWRTPARSGLAPLPLPVWPVEPWFGISFHCAHISSVYGVLLYPIFGGFARHAWLGPQAAAPEKLYLTETLGLNKKNNSHSALLLDKPLSF